MTDYLKIFKIIEKLKKKQTDIKSYTCNQQQSFSYKCKKSDSYNCFEIEICFTEENSEEKNMLNI